VREQFAAWYPLSSDDRRRFVTDGLVVLDTNVLLDLYRMTVEASEDVLALFRQLGDRLWIPHQVGLEFHRNRLTVIHEQEQTDRKLRAAVAEAGAKLHDAVKNMRDHPVIDRVALTTIIDQALASITDYLDQACKEPSLSMKAAMHADPVLDAVTDLLHGKVGPPYAVDQLAQVQAEARRRIDQRRPPGYADAKKDEDRATGDYVLWRQMLDEAAKRKLPVLFVTSDQKEDWYRQLHGHTVGPRVELVTEVGEEAGAAFHAQTLVRFLETAPSLLRSVVKETTVLEVNRLDEVDRAASRAEITSPIGEREIERRVLRRMLDRELHRQTDEKRALAQLTMDIARLEAQREDLSLRAAELQSELDSARSTTGQSGADRQPVDPRSYVRAVEVRLGTNSQMLRDLEDRLTMLQHERTVLESGDST